MKTYGRIEHGYKDGRRTFFVECEPHVSMRLKRVFAKLSNTSTGRHAISETPDTARDLLWFVERYPLEISAQARAALEHRAREHRELESLVDAMLTRQAEAPTFDLALPPREYQRQAAALAMKSGALLLADDVGLGKTVSALCMFTDPHIMPALVVTLTHLPRQWEAEIKKFAPKLRTHIVARGTPYDVTMGADGAKRKTGGDQMVLPGKLAGTFPDVVIINYHKLANWAETLAPFIRTLVFDEAQELRHDGSNKYGGARHLAERARVRVGLTATPIYNYGGEIHSVLEIIKPDALGTFEEFATEWCAEHQEKRKARIKDPDAFGTYLRDAGIMLRRTRKDVGRELPPLQRVIHHIDADPGELARIQGSAAELARVILGSGKGFDKMRAAQELDAMARQATGLAKAPFVAEFVRLLVETGEPVVLYAWHHAVYEMYRAKLKDLGIAFFTGEESAAHKAESFRRFTTGEARVLIMSLRAGAGLDGLQHHCRTVVFGELDWSPGVHEQCEGRVERDGQKDPVVVYYLVADVGSDPTVADVLGVKQGQIEGLRDPNGSRIAALQVDPDHIKKLAAAYLAKRGEAVADV